MSRMSRCSNAVPRDNPEAREAERLGIVTICYDFAARKRSFELLAEAYGTRPGELADATRIL